MTGMRSKAQSAAAVEWRLSPGVCQVLLVLWWAAIGWYYYHQPGYAPLWKVWPSLVPRLHDFQAWAVWRDLRLFALLLWLIGLGHGLGRTILRRSGLEAEPVGMFLLSLAVGWGLMGLSMLGLGLLKSWNFHLILACLVAGTAVLAAGRLRGLWNHREPPRSAVAPRNAVAAEKSWASWDVLWVLVLALFAGFNLLAAFMPEIFYDGLVYHLALPDLYWRRGGVVPTPENLHSGLPMLVEMLYAVALPLGGDGLAHLLHWAFGLGTAAWVYCLCRRFSPRSEALPAALFFYSTPLAGILSWKAGVDLGWAFFQMSALYALSLRLAQEPGDRRWTVLAGFLVGLAMGTKYQAWPMLAVFALALALTLPPPILRKENLRELALFAGIALAVLAPWCLKNLILYRNPIYPFLHEYFSSGPSVHWRLLLQHGGGRDIRVLLTTWEGFKSYLLHPWHLTFQYDDASSLGPVLLLGLPLLFLRRFAARPLKALWVALLGLWAVWSLTSTLSRFLLPHAPLACLLMGAGFEGLSRRLRVFLRPALLFVFCANAFWLSSWLATYGAGGVILGTEARSEYLSRPHPSYPRPPYAALEFINKQLAPEARILFIGEARGFYCERDRIASSAMDQEPLLGWIRRSRDGRELRDLLRRESITHVLVNRNEFAVWQGGSNRYLSLDPAGEKVFEEFQRLYLRPVFEQKAPPAADFSAPWTVVYELAG